jgi:hypothetical protein
VSPSAIDADDSSVVDFKSVAKLLIRRPDDDGDDADVGAAEVDPDVLKPTSLKSRLQ